MILSENQNGVIHMMGARIASLRRKAGLSQGELAQLLRCSASAVGMYEQGRREPASDTLVRLAEVFGVSTDYLLTGKASTAQEQQTAAELLLQGITRPDHRPDRPFSRQELAVLMAALLMEP